jgi:hypothetical protein
LADLDTARAARKDPLDLPRTMTQREVNAYAAETRILDATARGIRSAQDDIASGNARRAPLQADLSRLMQARTEAEQAGDADALDALQRGARFVDGAPLLPARLHAFFTTTCASGTWNSGGRGRLQRSRNGSPTSISGSTRRSDGWRPT